MNNVYKKMQYCEVRNNGRILRGMKHVYVGKKTKLPAIVLHGYFSGNKIGPNRLFVQIAETVKSLGYDVFRFDLSGMGESSEEISKVNFNIHVQDLSAILAWIRKSYKNNPVTIISHCLGCNVSLVNIIKKPRWVNRAIFLSPYYTNEKTLDLFFTSKEQINELKKMGHTYRKGLHVNKSFFYEQNTEKNFIANFKKSKISIDVIISGRDQYIPPESNKLVFDKIGISPISIKNADHNFLSTRNELLTEISNLLEYSE